MNYAEPDLKPSGFGETNDNSDCDRGYNGLTILQRRVLQMIADGFDTGSIGEELNLSTLAIDATLGVARSRLGAASNLHAIALAMRSGEVK